MPASNLSVYNSFISTQNNCISNVFCEMTQWSLVFVYRPFRRTRCCSAYFYAL